jgi:hypothetical protein
VINGSLKIDSLCPDIIYISLISAYACTVVSVFLIFVI